MKATVECLDANRHVLATLTVDYQWGQPITIPMPILAADTTSIRVDPTTANSLLAGQR